MEVRLRKVQKGRLRSTRFSKIRNIYFIKNITYGKYVDTYDYNKVQLSFTTNRSEFGKKKDGQKLQRSLDRTRRMIYYLVEANKQYSKRQKSIFFTLTFKEQTKDLKKASQAIKAFVRRLKQYMPEYPRYIVVPELHKSGNVHFHGVLFNLPFIDILTFKEEIWRNGSVDLQLPRKIKSVARYLCKYLTKDTLENLPLHQKAYFTSRNLIRPHTHLTDEYPSDIIKRLEMSVTKNYIKQKFICKQ